ncbi:MAG: tetratricopeptide repeat protein [Syntrophobacteraceae bacterium]
MLAIMTSQKIVIVVLSAIALTMSVCFTDLALAIDYSIKQASLRSDTTTIEKTAHRKLAMERQKARSLYKKGNLDFDQKYYDKAIASYLRAIDLEPSFTPSYYNLGMVHLAIGQKKEAAGYLKTFLDLRPNAVNADELRQLIQYLRE